MWWMKWQSLKAFAMAIMNRHRVRFGCYFERASRRLLVVSADTLCTTPEFSSNNSDDQPGKHLGGFSLLLQLDFLSKIDSGLFLRWDFEVSVVWEFAAHFALQRPQSLQVRPILMRLSPSNLFLLETSNPPRFPASSRR